MLGPSLCMNIKKRVPPTPHPGVKPVYLFYFQSLLVQCTQMVQVETDIDGLISRSGTENHKL